MSRLVELPGRGIALEVDMHTCRAAPGECLSSDVAMRNGVGARETLVGTFRGTLPVSSVEVLRPCQLRQQPALRPLTAHTAPVYTRSLLNPQRGHLAGRLAEQAGQHRSARLLLLLLLPPPPLTAGRYCWCYTPGPGWAAAWTTTWSCPCAGGGGGGLGARGLGSGLGNKHNARCKPGQGCVAPDRQ